MKDKIRVIELFAGIGAVRKALMKGGYNFEIVDAIEIDPHPVASYNAIYNENIIPQDITQYKPTRDSVGEIDLLWNSSPCQDISLAGTNKGADEGSGTRSSLVYEVIRIVNDIKPKYIIWENVKGLLSSKHKHILDDYIKRLEDIGYTSYYQVLNASDYGLPQNRERVFTVSIRNDIDKEFIFPQKQELQISFKDIVDNVVDEKYKLSNEKLNRIANWKCFEKPLTKIYGRNSISRTLTTHCGAESGGLAMYSDGLEDTTNLQNEYATQNYPNIQVRKITPREAWKLMGFDGEDCDRASQFNRDGALYKQAGNSVCVDVILAILRQLF